MQPQSERKKSVSEKLSTVPRLKVGVIGCGRISEKHFSAIMDETVGADLVAVADTDHSKAREKSGKYNVPGYTSYDEMLEKHPEIDLIDVLTPTGYHAEHVIDLFRFNRHIVVEKPMALRIEDADAMIAAQEKSGRRLFVIKQNRFNQAVMAVRHALEQGRFGKLVMGTVRVRWKRDQRYYDQADWRGTFALDGGVMAQQASHHLDLLQWFMGPVESLECRAATRLMNIEVEDTAAAVMKFSSGALGVFEATVATRPEDLEGSISLLGEKGSVVIGGTAVNKIEYWKFFDPREEDDQVVGEFSETVSNVYGNGHVPCLRNIVDAIRNDTPALVEGREGKKTVEFLSALYESACLEGASIKPGGPAVHSRLGIRL
jgi:predicted dehydrogenase